MSDLEKPYLHLKSVLNEQDISFLKESCKQQLLEHDIPCFALINRLDHPCVQKIRNHVEKSLGKEVFYFNDFYMYTDSGVRAGWHMDTELFTFEYAINAWILLSPETIESPLRMLSGINDSDDNCYHIIRSHNGVYEFGNLSSGDSLDLTLTDIENRSFLVPELSLGDILLFNPRLFRCTNTTKPKHCHVLKFVFGGNKNALLEDPVPSYFWPEVEIFSDLVGGKESWNDVIEGLKSQLKTESGKKNLSAGFYPDKFKKYSDAVKLL